MEANVSDELIEAMARAIYESQFVDEWSGGDGIEAEQFRQCARALIPVIRAHLEPNERMAEAGAIEAQKPAGWHSVYRNIWRAMLAASPIGEIG